MTERNPDCACGCGKEVRLPSNRYLLGHSGRYPHRDKRELLKQAEELLKSGMSQNAVGKTLGVTGATISNWFGRRAQHLPTHGLPLTPTCDPTIYHQSDVDERKEKWQWQLGRRKRNKVKKLLRSLNR